MCDGNVIEMTGRVKWFNQYKGYGFVEIKGIPEDVFLHFSVVEEANVKELGKDDVILCEVLRSAKGFQITKIKDVISRNKYSVGDKAPEKISAVMKWFNPSKGFGFAQLKTGEDVFIHSSLLKKLDIKSIEPNQKVELLVHHTNLGYEAIDMSVHNDK